LFWPALFDNERRARNSGKETGMSDDLDMALAETAGASAETSVTEDSVIDAVFDAPSGDAATPDTSTETPAAPEPAAATEQPQSETPSAEGAKGEPPRERWDTILQNARTKAREETLAEHRERLEVLDRLRDDLPGTLGQLLDEGVADPRFSEALLSKAAAILSARRQEAKANTEPEADLQTADGALVYSADQLRKWHQWNAKQQETAMSARFAPLQQLQARIQEHEQFQQTAREAAGIAAERGEAWREMPFFAENKPAILARQQELYAEMQTAAQAGQRRGDAVNDPWHALQRAYREVVSTQAIPKLQSQQTQTIVQSNARKAAGSMTDPAASAPARPRKPRTEDEALEQVFGAI